MIWNHNNLFRYTPCLIYCNASHCHHMCDYRVIISYRSQWQLGTKGQKQGAGLVSIMGSQCDWDLRLSYIFRNFQVASFDMEDPKWQENEIRVSITLARKKEAWSALKLPSVQLCLMWSSKNTVAQHQQMTWHPNHYFLHTIGHWFLSERKTLVFSENNFLWTKVQFFF